jgi:DNA-binding transcriptional ArsR family regulator
LSRAEGRQCAARPSPRETSKPRPTGPAQHQKFLSPFRQNATATDSAAPTLFDSSSGLRVNPELTLLLSTMEGSILELLEEYGSLGYEQIAALLSEPAAAVRSALTDLRESGLVDAISVGELQAHTAEAASYWRLTDAGRQELARRRSE